MGRGAVDNSPLNSCPPAQRPNRDRTRTARSVRPVCALRAHPLSRLPAKTTFGGLPPPFPTSPPPQGDPEGEVGNSPGKSSAGRRDNGAGETPPGHQPTPHGSPEVSPPHPHFLTPPSHPPGAPVTAGAQPCGTAGDGPHAHNRLRPMRLYPDGEVAELSGGSSWHPPVRADSGSALTCAPRAARAA